MTLRHWVMNGHDGVEFAVSIVSVASLMRDEAL